MCSSRSDKYEIVSHSQGALNAQEWIMYSWSAAAASVSINPR